MPKTKTPPSSASSAEAKSAPKGKQILIVEDERPLAHALELKFNHEGFSTTIATDGVEALKQAKSGGFSLILLDLIMPRMDGFTFLEELKNENVKVPTIVLSNLGQDEDKARAKELGALEYYVKSNTPITEIVKKVKSAL